ncbi:Kelch repeat-containing protein [Aliikangiella sp. IMCC44632]
MKSISQKPLTSGQALSSQLKLSATSLLLLLITACGGGSGEKDPTVPPPPPPPPSLELPAGWEELADIPAGVAHSAAVNIGDKIYLAGGYDSKRSLYIYNITTNSWTTGSDLPEGTDSLSAISHEGKIYLMGGEASRSVQVYDPSADQWTDKFLLAGDKFSSATQKVNQNVHLIGGWNYNNDNSNSLTLHQTYDLALNSLSDSQLAPLMVARNCSVSGVIDNKIVVAAGRAPGIRSTDSFALSTTEIYDIELDGWEFGGELTTARACAAHSVLDNKLYALGGLIPPAKFIKTIERYNLASNDWELVGNMPFFTSGAVAVTVGEAIYVFGGYYNLESDAATTKESNKAFKFIPGS